MLPAEIKTRCAAIGLKAKRLAALAGVHEDTAERVLNRKSEPLVGTLAKLTGALEAEEVRVRDALVALHGLPDLPEGTDVVRIGGVPRRVVLPVVDRAEGKAA